MSDSDGFAEDIAKVFAKDFAAQIMEHETCRWEQIGPCVYCVDHDVRLYQGRLPEERRTIPKCATGAHQWDNGDSMSQSGFYLLCLRCGEQEWT